MNAHDLNITANNEKIEQTKSTTFLGIVLDEHCTWYPHIDKICSKLHSFVYAIYKLLKISNQHTALMAYHGYVVSVLRYGLILWGNSRQVNRAFIAQKRCVRALFNAAPTDSCKPLFKKLNLLSLPSLYIYEMACFAKKNEKMFLKNGDIYSFRTRYPNKYVLPSCRTDFYYRSCYPMVIKIYNKLPEDLKLLPFSLFKKYLHEWLVQNCFYCINDFLSLKVVQIKINKRTVRN